MGQPLSWVSDLKEVIEGQGWWGLELSGSSTKHTERTGADVFGDWVYLCLYFNQGF